MIFIKAAQNAAAKSVLILTGCFLYAAAFNIFLLPNKIAPGGVSGLAAALNYLFKFPPGVVIIILNVPLFALGKKILGLKFLLKTICATALLSLFIDLLKLPRYTAEPLLAAIIGGVLCGIGTGIVCIGGAMTGGTDLLARLIRHKNTRFSLGRLIFFADGCVVIIAGLVFRDITAAFYSALCVFLISKAFDAALKGFEHSTAAIIITERSAEISGFVIEKLERTTTRMSAKGGYSRDDKQVLLCVVKAYELTRLKNGVNEIDKTAFIITFDAAEVLGEGF